MENNPSRLHPAPNRRYANMLGQVVRARRQELRLSVQRAARLASMPVDRWMAIESGHSIPADDGRELKKILVSIDHSYLTLSFAALVSRYNSQ
jgi:hypothetical protein